MFFVLFEIVVLTSLVSFIGVKWSFSTSIFLTGYYFFLDTLATDDLKLSNLIWLKIVCMTFTC